MQGNNIANKPQNFPLFLIPSPLPRLENSQSFVATAVQINTPPSRLLFRNSFHFLCLYTTSRRTTVLLLAAPPGEQRRDDAIRGVLPIIPNYRLTYPALFLRLYYSNNHLRTAHPNLIVFTTLSRNAWIASPLLDPTATVKICPRFRCPD